ncbi:MAG: hypothetical protein OEX17_03090 [Rhodospirillaceae bacterium]|nr:hypothetical protein [Rhodospirillaceae bacterium]
MGIAEILAVLAFFVAMVALWLVSDVLKKVDAQNEKFISAHIRAIRADINEFDDKLQNFSKALKLLEEKIKSTDAEILQQSGAAKETINKLEKKLLELDQSIPQRFREKPQARPRSIQ